MAETWDRACPLFEETVQIHTHNVCWQGPRRPLVLRVLRKADGYNERMTSGGARTSSNQSQNEAAGHNVESYHGPLAIELCDPLRPDRLLRAHITPEVFQLMSVEQRIRVPFSQFAGHLVRLLGRVTLVPRTRGGESRDSAQEEHYIDNASPQELPGDRVGQSVQEPMSWQGKAGDATRVEPLHCSAPSRDCFQLSLSLPGDTTASEGGGHECGRGACAAGAAPTSSSASIRDDSGQVTDPWQWSRPAYQDRGQTASDPASASKSTSRFPSRTTNGTTHAAAASIPGLPSRYARSAVGSLSQIDSTELGSAAVLEIQEAMEFALVRHLAIELTAAPPTDAASALASQLRLAQRRLAATEAQRKREGIARQEALAAGARAAAALSEARSQHDRVLSDERSRHERELAMVRQEAKTGVERAEASTRGDLAPRVRKAEEEAMRARELQMEAGRALEDARAETRSLAEALAEARSVAKSEGRRAEDAAAEAAAARAAADEAATALSAEQRQTATLRERAAALQTQCMDARALADGAERARLAEAAARAAMSETTTALRAAATTLNSKLHKSIAQVERGNTIIRQLQQELRRAQAAKEELAADVETGREALDESRARVREAMDEAATARRGMEEAEAARSVAVLQAKRSGARLREGKELLRRQEHAMAALHARVTSLRAQQLGASPGGSWTAGRHGMVSYGLSGQTASLGPGSGAGKVAGAGDLASWLREKGVAGPSGEAFESRRSEAGAEEEGKQSDGYIDTSLQNKSVLGQGAGHRWQEDEGTRGDKVMGGKMNEGFQGQRQETGADRAAGPGTPLVLNVNSPGRSGRRTNAQLATGGVLAARGY